MRERAAAGLAFLGVKLDPRRNAKGSGDREIGGQASRVRSLVVEAREDLQIAAEVRLVLSE